jgi:1-deoxy-D-xylulose-5-phosphate synthase
VAHHLAHKGLLDHGLRFRPMNLPDRFIDHDSQKNQLAEAGLDAKAITDMALAALGQDVSGQNPGQAARA